ncbi:hypothetical protein PV396_27565 [Streptomyces sp. ME02-8801-2C]|uniref:hypothetical protein n=1 Tax=Streptomyces sp. ME02-8801-2C TaxID=3028680 RepID=UPI0029B3A1BC|nr:hypothetical protein [Streptomyces sp. ME02-8801-2C]MDX3455652.1 hypothetical protein [Streptomyces sp. ME02-8801-2C]
MKPGSRDDGEQPQRRPNSRRDDGERLRRRRECAGTLILPALAPTAGNSRSRGPPVVRRRTPSYAFVRAAVRQPEPAALVAPTSVAPGDSRERSRTAGRSRSADRESRVAHNPARGDTRSPTPISNPDNI